MRREVRPLSLSLWTRTSTRHVADVLLLARSKRYEQRAAERATTVRPRARASTPRPSSLLRAGPAAFSTRYAVRVGSRRLTHTLSEPRLARLGFVAARSPLSSSSLTTASRQRPQAVLPRASMQAQASHHAPLEALVAIQARLKPPRPPAPDSAAPPRSALDTATASLHGWLGDLAALVRPLSPCSPTSPHRHRVTSSSSAGRPSLRGALEPPQVHALTLARYRTASLPTPRATSPRSCARST